jgi:hypothetical protein
MSYQGVQFENGNIAPVKVGEHIVRFELIVQDEHSGIDFTATSDTGGTASGRMTLPNKHDHSDEQFVTDIKEFAWRLAQEAAGRGHAKNLVAKFFPKQ